MRDPCAVASRSAIASAVSRGPRRTSSAVGRLDGTAPSASHIRSGVSYRSSYGRRSLLDDRLPLHFLHLRDQLLELGGHYARLWERQSGGFIDVELAEEAARAYPAALVLRTSFRPREWPYETAFDDLYTSQDYVDVIAPLVAEVVYRFDRGEVPYDTLHVATERKSVYELARRRAPDVQRASRASAR